KPRVPPAPGRTSTTIACPRFCDTWSSTTRPVVSEALPAANGLITRIGRVGQSCARAVVAAMRVAATPTKKRARMGILTSQCADYVATAGFCLREDVAWVTSSLREVTRVSSLRAAAWRRSNPGQHVQPLDCFGTPCLAMTTPYKMMLG